MRIREIEYRVWKRLAWVGKCMQDFHSPVRSFLDGTIKINAELDDDVIVAVRLTDPEVKARIKLLPDGEFTFLGCNPATEDAILRVWAYVLTYIDKVDSLYRIEEKADD